MAELKDKIENALNESRTLILGAEILLGFEYQSVLQSRFTSLSQPTQTLRIAGLALMLLAVALLIVPVPYHRLVARGEDTQDLNRFITRVAGLSLLPFGLGVGIDSTIALEAVLGAPLAAAGGVIILVVAMFFWYGLETIDRRTYGPKVKVKEHKMGDDSKPPASTPLPEKIKQVMTELRIVIPGIQALLGFQLASTLMDGFQKLPESSKMVHLASLAFITLSTILLMTPAAYHRIVEQGEDSERFLRFASRMLLGSMVFLALGMAGDFYIVTEKIVNSTLVALIIAALSLLVLYGLWFGYTVYRSRQTHEVHG